MRIFESALLYTFVLSGFSLNVFSKKYSQNALLKIYLPPLFKSGGKSNFIENTMNCHIAP
jgi:hypothetical protein